MFDHHTHALSKGYFGLARRGGSKLLIKKFMGDQQFEVF